MSKFGPRAAPIKAAIDETTAKERALVQQQRQMLGDLGATPDQLAKINAELRAHRDKRTGLEELLRTAHSLDKRDTFLADREAIKSDAEEMLQVIASREADAKEIDELVAKLGEVLARIEEKNRRAWPIFTKVTRDLTVTTDTRHRHVYDSAVWANQARISTGAACGSAFVGALRAAGVGATGLAADMLFPITSYRYDGGQTVEEAMRDANQRVERHLGLLFKAAANKVAEVLHVDDGAAS